MDNFLTLEWKRVMAEYANKKGMENGKVNFCFKNCLEIKSAEISLKEEECVTNCWANYQYLSDAFEKEFGKN